MSRKGVIEIGIIVVMIGGSVFVLYRGFGGSSTPGTSTPTTQPVGAQSLLSPAGTPSGTPGAPGAGGLTAESGFTVSDPNKILPFGNRFDLGLVKKYNPDANTNNYPKVDPTTELEPPLNDLVKKNQ